MPLWDRVTRMLALEPWQHERVELSTPAEDIIDRQINLRSYQRASARRATVSEALGVPAVQRAVTLISHTVGSLTMQGLRNGATMPETPTVLARPNPYQTPVDTYRGTAFGMATYGEGIFWIAARDGAGFPIALVKVPSLEVSVQANPVNRFRPTYWWGKPDQPASITGTRYSPVTPDGNFVHIAYHWDEQGLRGLGPLQMCGAAVSVAVEAQLWAGGFFASGGVPPLVIKSAVELGLTPGSDAATEAQLLRAAWMAGEINTPKVIDPGIESVTQFDTNPQGAQMLDSRLHDVGEVARMFGIPGALLEYNSPGSLLTYKNVTDVWDEFLKGCLTPSYLEPIEAHMSDLLPRTQSARFNIASLLRADIKTRFETYDIGVPLGIITVEQAQQQEGIIPGDIERMPVAPSPPAAIFASRDIVRCDGDRMRNGVLQVCNALLAEQGPFVGTCRRCGKRYPVRTAA